MSDPGDETPDWPARLGEMEHDVTGCANDCCHPDHNHGGEVNAYAARLTWRETLEKAREFNALPDTHAEWRSLNESGDA